MPSSGSRKQRYFCDYCDSFLTHDSLSVRREHNAGYKHKANVKSYYLMYSEEGQATLDAEARGLPPPVFMNPPIGGGPPPVGGGPPMPRVGGGPPMPHAGGGPPMPRVGGGPPPPHAGGGPPMPRVGGGPPMPHVGPPPPHVGGPPPPRRY